MTRLLSTLERTTGVYSTSADRPYFGRYKREEIKEVRKPDVIVGKVEDLKKAWVAYKYTNLGNYPNEEKKCLEIIKGMQYSAKDVENFSIALAEFQDDKNFGQKAGFFLSVLINNCQDESYVIHTRHLHVEISYIGFQNTKDITIDGGACWVGWRMQGGRIIVNGDVNHLVGHEMQDGEIHINGSCESISTKISGGRIYYREKLVYPK